MVVVVGFDTEYVKQTAEFTLSETELKRNRVLSYQLYILDTETGHQTGIVIPILHGEKISGRMKLGSLLELGFAQALREKTIASVPEKIILVAHFWRADLPALKDFKYLKRKLDAVRNTYVSSKQPFVQKFRLHGRPQKTSITVIDTMLLAPGGHQSLAKLGELLVVDKITLPDGMIEHMDVLQRDRPELFERYALRDAEIAAKWVQEMIRFLDEDVELKYSQLPVTLGSISVKLFTQGIDELALSSLLAKDEKKGSSEGILCSVSDLISFFANCYYGGRNEAYVVGYHSGVLTDIDLAGAYTTAMAAIRLPDWNGLKETTDLNILAHPEALSVARIKFKFPCDTRYPSLPVRAGAFGLIYPLEGETYCTGPELVVAIDQGAKIQVEKGVFVPWLNNVRPFAEFTKKINQMRDGYHKGTLLERISKEIGNSLYGKTAQGVANMRGDKNTSGRSRGFNSRSGEMNDLPPSKITQPLLAAYITGLVRAVLSELISKLPSKARLLTATTDGFLSDIGPGELDMSGPMITLFMQLREIVSGDINALEEKGQIAEAIIVKTRGTISTKPMDTLNPGKPILAKAGNKLEDPIDDAWQESLQWEEIYKTREFNTKHTHRRLIDLKSQWQKDADLIDEERDIRVNLDFDLKRQPKDVVDVKGLINFTTDPWQSVDQFLEYREVFDQWRKKKSRVLRTKQDWLDFLEYKRLIKVKVLAGVKTNQRPPVAQLFLRSYARGLHGLPGKDFRDAAEFLSEYGWSTENQNVKDAKRRGRQTLGAAIDLSDEDRQFLHKVQERWPAFDLQGFTGQSI